MAAGILFTGGQIGAEMPQPGVFREPCTEMKEAVQVTLHHLEQVTLAADFAAKLMYSKSQLFQKHQAVKKKFSQKPKSTWAENPYFSIICRFLTRRRIP